MLTLLFLLYHREVLLKSVATFLAKNLGMIGEVVYGR